MERGEADPDQLHFFSLHSSQQLNLVLASQYRGVYHMCLRSASHEG